MKIFKKPIIVTHSGNFHPDDVFSVATLHIYLKGKYKLIRTRDENIINKADFVVDVGGKYDVKNNRFDHHQKEGAGQRENTIPYASFGLVWKEFGPKICHSQSISDEIDKKIVSSCDAYDNGQSIFKSVIKDIEPYQFIDFIFSFNPSWKDEKNYDKKFKEALFYAVLLIKNNIEKERTKEEGYFFVENIYKNSEYKEIIKLDNDYPWRKVLSKYPEPIYVIKKDNQNNWKVMAVPIKDKEFDVRKPFPESWAGLNNENLIKVSGVKDAVFCHKGRFVVVAKSYEGALELAKKALLM